MRTDIEIDDALMAEAMKATGVTTKRAVVEEGLRLLVQMKHQEDIFDLAGKVHWDGDLDRSRLDRIDE